MLSTRFEGIVIGHEDWGDVDRLVSFYTPNFGKVEAVARGVRHEKSKLKGHLELLSHGQFAVAKNHGRGVLTDALSYETFSGMYARPEAAYLGHVVAHFYDAYLYPAAPDAALWQLLCDTLSMLNGSTSSDQATATSHPNTALYQGKEILERALDCFAREFLRHLGYFDRNGGGVMESLSATSHFNTAVYYSKAEANFQKYDALLMQTDIAGPTFSEASRNLAKISASS